MNEAAIRNLMEEHDGFCVREKITSVFTSTHSTDLKE